MTSPKHSNIHVFDDLTNKLKWAAGTLDSALEYERIELPTIDAISSAKSHLDEVLQLVGHLKPEARVFADADGNGANARLLNRDAEQDRRETAINNALRSLYSVKAIADRMLDDEPNGLIGAMLHEAERAIETLDSREVWGTPEDALRRLEADGAPGTEAQQAAQRAIERGDDPDTVADIEADTREVLDENSGDTWHVLHSIGQLATAIFDDSDCTDSAHGHAFAIIQLANRERERHT